jgi:hypothetical protein
MQVVAHAYNGGRENGGKEERAAVVAWLRRGDACCAANATRIENGAHHREGEE